MKYVGIQTLIRRNNFKSMLLLVCFPLYLLAMVYGFIYLINYAGSATSFNGREWVHMVNMAQVNSTFLDWLPWVVGFVAVWFAIAYSFNVSIIQHATGARPLSRSENPRIYNIVENLCMTCGMDMPKINIVDDPQLNAFASGINAKTYTVTLTTGIINRLNDEELAGVIGHELTHIRNHDTKLLITSIVFVGIVSALMTIVARTLYYNMWFGAPRSRDDDDDNNSSLSFMAVMLIALVCIAIAYVFTLLTRFAISRKREYMADAGGAELCGDPLALASALRKISTDPGLDNVKRPDVAQLFIMQPDEMKSGLVSFVDSLFSTHPSTEKRIKLLEQY